MSVTGIARCSFFPRHVAFAVCALFSGASIAFAESIVDGQGGESTGAPFSINHHVIAAGGVTRAKNACFELASTIGQPIGGRSEGGVYTLDAGFLARRIETDSLFRSSFEACQ